MKTCPNCSTQLKDEAKFCYNCGQKVFVEKPKMVFCEECGEKIESTVKVCPYCGHTVELYELPKVEEEKSEPAEPIVQEKQVVAPPPIVVPITGVANVELPKQKGQEVKKEEAKEENPINAIRCPQCGSTSVKMETETVGRCLHCGAGITIDDRPKNVVNNVNVFVQKKNEAVVSFYKVEKDKSGKQFIKDTYMTLAEHELTPLDIFDYQYSPVSEEEKIVVAYRGDVHLTYSAQIGIDRMVEYIENGKTKTKIVTDWHPVSGRHEGNYIVGVPDGDITYEETLMSKNEYAGLFEHAVDTAKSIKEFDGEGIVLTQSNAEAGKKALKEKAAIACKMGLAGDRIKDFSCSAIIDIQEVRGYVIPEYAMTYKENEKSEKTYVAYGYAAGDDFVYGSCPDDTRNINADTTISNLKFTIPSILLFLASIIVSLVVENLVVMYVIAFAAIAFFVFSVLISKRLRKTVIKRNIETKKKKMQELIQKQGLAE